MTAQIKEELIYFHKKFKIITIPGIPEEHPRIAKDSLLNPVFSSRELLSSTGCSRKYQGTWKVEKNRLYLFSIRGKYSIVGDAPVFADWYSGTLKIPLGLPLVNFHFGFGAIHEKEAHMHIENGILIKTDVIENKSIDIKSSCIF